MEKSGKDTLKRNNKLLLLNWLRAKDLSRSELSEATALSNSSVSTLVAELAAEHIVFEKETAASSGGRRPVILSINPSAACSLLLKVTYGRIIIAAVDLKLRIIFKRSYAYEGGEEALTKALLAGLGEARSICAAKADNIAGVGVSLPGLVDHASGNILNSAELHLKNFKLKDVMRQELGHAANIHVFKDADALMLGEYLLSGSDSIKSYLYLLVDSGVGMSFMNGGELLQLSQSGLELGHLQLEPEGPACRCGKRGCVEAMVSEYAVQRELAGLDGGDAAAPPLRQGDVIALANEGDARCREVLLGQARYLGRAAALAVNIFAPNRVIIGGPLKGVKWDAFYEELDRSLYKNALSVFDYDVVFTDTGDKECFLGMADRIFTREFYGE
jgi:predicted NBD/HSP70 family sugar kinase